MASPAPTLKLQNWADNLRLPCFMNASETAPLLAAVDSYRKPSIPFQSKHLHALKRNTWYVLRRPADRSRTGLVIVWPEQRCCVFVSGDPPTAKRPTPRVALLRLRLDPQFIAAGTGLTVFTATLSATTRQLCLEDTLLWKGRHVFGEESFHKRIQMAVQWLEHYCILDPRLMNDLDIVVAPWSPLSTLVPEGTWELQSDDEGSRRLLWIANQAAAIPELSPMMTPTKTPVMPKLDGGPLIAVATRESGPDQWGLTASDGVSLGRGLVRTMEVSHALRSVKTNTVRVEVTWISTFNKWEIKGVTFASASHSGEFEMARVQI
jgi:hypothetical protein